MNERSELRASVTERGRGSSEAMPSDEVLAEVERYIITNTQRCWEGDYKPSLKEAFAAVLSSTLATKEPR